jgi:SAM-dependent methyltransferase
VGLFYCVVALSAFLLFLVQPIIARQILPWFGGSAAVWTTSMVFFQTALLAGYAYADIGGKTLKPRTQALVHIVFAVLCLVLLPIIPGVSWKPTGGEAPIVQILLLLTVVIGLPYTLLSTTSPLVQSWFARAYPGRDPYRLFAVSNAASVLALVGYPFLLEPNAGTTLQAWIWSGLFVVFVIALCALAWRTSQVEPVEENVQSVATDTQGEAVAPLSALTMLKWLGFSATGSIVLLSITNHLSHNIPSVPMMWLLPLTIYLITFILTFDGRGWYVRVAFIGPVIIALGAMGWLLLDTTYQFDLPVQAVVFTVSLFVICMFCHGELVAAKPASAHLTRFYLCISIGGALGSALVGIAAPLLLNGFFEMAGSILCVAVLLAVVSMSGAGLFRGLASAVLVAAVYLVYTEVKTERSNAVSMSRNFYGTLKVKSGGEANAENHYLKLVHGAILHGLQYTHDKYRKEPSTYYTKTSGLGRITLARQAEQVTLKLGMIGLGVGTYAAYGRTGDLVKFYDIDPAVIDQARNTFTYLKDSQAKIEIALGDARLSLDRESPQNFDILAVDAFSGDSIPTHLITREAVEGFMRHLLPNGVLAYHTSNRYIDLPPVLEAIASASGLSIVMVEDSPQDNNALHTISTWVLLSRTTDALKGLANEVTAVPKQPSWKMWTDDYNNLFQVLKGSVFDR